MTGRRAVAVVASLLLWASSSAEAEETWTPRQRQVLAAMERLSLATAPDGGGAAAYAAVLAPGFSRWTVGSTTINDKSSWVASVKEWFDEGWRVTDRTSLNLEILVRGNYAFTRRTVEETYRGPKDERSTSTAALAEVWVREAGDWRLLLANVQPTAESTQATPSNLTSKPAELCYPPYWGGLLPGSSTDAELVRLYGPGIFRETGYDGQRHYTDAERTITLSVTWATDRIIAEVELRSGFHPPPDASKDELAVMVAPALEARTYFGNVGALTLGSAMESVTENLGPPHSVRSDEATGAIHWVYESRCACELAKGIAFEFRSAALVAVLFWSSPG